MDFNRVINSLHLLSEARRKPATLHSAGMMTSPPSKCLTLLWGATGEQEWTPALTTGKSGVKGFDAEDFLFRHYRALFIDPFPCAAVIRAQSFNALQFTKPAN